MRCLIAVPVSVRTSRATFIASFLAFSMRVSIRHQMPAMALSMPSAKPIISHVTVPCIYRHPHSALPAALWAFTPSDDVAEIALPS